MILKMSEWQDGVEFLSSRVVREYEWLFTGIITVAKGVSGISDRGDAYFRGKAYPDIGANMTQGFFW